jgi:hypothetical protein
MFDEQPQRFDSDRLAVVAELRQSTLGFVLCDPSDGVDGVVDGVVIVHGFAFGPQRMQASVAEGVSHSTSFSSAYSRIVSDIR